MAFSKEGLYPPEEVIATSYFRALGHSARRRILRQLKRESILCVFQIASEHPVSQETLSQHLAILREAGLLDCEEIYPYTYYWINEKNLEKAMQYCCGFFDDLKKLGQASKKRRLPKRSKPKRR